MSKRCNPSLDDASARPRPWTVRPRHSTRSSKQRVPGRSVIWQRWLVPIFGTARTTSTASSPRRGRSATTIAERIVLDTDVVSRLLRGSLTDDITERLTGAVLLVTFVTVGELFRGAAHARWGPRRIATLTSWLKEVPAIPGDPIVARRWGEITDRLCAQAGRFLPTTPGSQRAASSTMSRWPPTTGVTSRRSTSSSSSRRRRDGSSGRRVPLP